MTIEAPADGGQGAAPAPAAAAPTPAPAAPAPAIDWLPDADEVTVGLVQNKGWKAPKDVLTSYQQLEKFVGAPADKIVRLPGEGAAKDELDAFYSKLGRPADPTGYEIKLPDGADDTFAKTAATKFHELGLNKQQAQELVKWYEGQGASMTEAQQQASQAANLAQQEALKQEWGQAYDQQVTAARQFAQGAGIDAATLDKLQGAMGYDGVMKFMANLGAKMGAEPAFPGGDRKGGFGGVMTPGQAQAEIASLKRDKDWSAKYLAGSAEHKARMTQLMSWAYPGDR
jgi:hypothetical protein